MKWNVVAILVAYAILFGIVVAECIYSNSPADSFSWQSILTKTVVCLVTSAIFIAIYHRKES